MLIDLRYLVDKYRMEVTGVLHLGGHTGEEVAKYAECGITNVWWVDCNPRTMSDLRAHVAPYGHHVIEACVTDSDGGQATFNVTNNNQSSSLLPLGTHKVVSPDVWYVDTLTLPTRTVDSLVAEHGITGCNLINADLQGGELLALRGATETLGSVDWLYLEVNADELYVGCARIGELDAYLTDFERVETEWAGRDVSVVGWGDALYRKVPL